MGRHSGCVGSTVASQQQCPQFEPLLSQEVYLCGVLPVPVWVAQSKCTHVRLSGDAKLPFLQRVFWINLCTD